jgi:RIO kinase 1
MKIPARLQEMIDEGIIDDVLGRLLSGKEASVFVVGRGDDVCAAKVYKAREGRTFKNVAAYVEGRNQTRNSRNKRAMQKKSRYGQELLETSWREAEHNALQAAFNAGVRVPEPFFLYEEVLLMELVVDEEGDPAPRLADFDLNAEVAGLLHHEAFLQVRRLLMAGLIHGDLSAFNILVAHDGLTLIDLPQIVDAASNNDAAELLARDLRNLTEHLAKFDPRLFRFRECGRALWKHYQKGSLEDATEPEEGAIGRRRGRRHQGGSRREGSQGGQRRDGGQAGEQRSGGGRSQGGREEEARARGEPRPGGRRKRQPKAPQIERVGGKASAPSGGAPSAPTQGAPPEGAPKKRRRRRRRPSNKPSGDR